MQGIICTAAKSWIITKWTFHNRDYLCSDLLVDMGKVCHVKGFDSLCISLKGGGPGRYGRLYELQVGARLSENGSIKLVEFSRKVGIPGASNVVEGATDIDLVIELLANPGKRIYVQCKLSKHAYGYGKRGVRSTVRWIRISQFQGADEIWYINPSNAIPPRVDRLLSAIENGDTTIINVPLRKHTIDLPIGE